MKIDLEGFGIYEIKQEKYKDFVEFLKFDMDNFLHIVSMSKFVIPMLCLNFESVESEGPKPYGHIPTEIGNNRIDYLINHNIIFK